MVSQGGESSSEFFCCFGDLLPGHPIEPVSVLASDHVLWGSFGVLLACCTVASAVHLYSVRTVGVCLLPFCH